MNQFYPSALEIIVLMAWLRSTSSALVSPIKTSISWLQSLFSKPKPQSPPQDSPSRQPPLSLPHSTLIKLFDSSNLQLQAIPSSPTSYRSSMDQLPLNPISSPQKEHVVNIPNKDSFDNRQKTFPEPRPTIGNSRRLAQSEGLPVYIVQNTNTVHPPQPTQPQTPQMFNPIVQLLRGQDLGKTVLTFVVPLTTGILSIHTKISPTTKDSSTLPLPLTLVSVCVGLSALWNGILLRNKFPNVANAVEQLGAGCIFFAFFSVVGSLLQSKLVWVPWACFVCILLPFVLSFVPKIKLTIQQYPNN